MILQEDIDFLEHHGVKGMKWGVINKPQSRKERASRNVEKAAGYQKKIDTLKASPKRFGKNGEIKNLSEKRDKQLAKADAKSSGKLTKNQKRALVAGGIVAAYATYKIADTGEFNRLALKGKDHMLGREAHEWAKDPRLATPDMDLGALKLLVVDKINPNYGEAGTKNNCRRATMAYEMRRRGNDVKATRSIKGAGQTAAGMVKATTEHDLAIPSTRAGIIGRTVIEQYEIATGKYRPLARNMTQQLERTGLWGKETIDLTPGRSSSDVFSAISRQPNGARGELGVKFKMGGGHSMAWEVIRGKAVVIDAQTGHLYRDADEFSRIGNNISNAGLTRLDNIPLNTNQLMRWMRNA